MGFVLISILLILVLFRLDSIHNIMKRRMDNGHEQARESTQGR